MAINEHTLLNEKNTNPLSDKSNIISNKDDSNVYIYIYINRIRMFVCLSVGYTLLIKPNSIHMLYMGRSGIYRGKFLSKN